jgi:RecJ-like exonuclease
MTDPIRCPECGGSGEEKLGALTLQCQFCRGAGGVGGENERAKDEFRTPQAGERYDPEVHGPLPPVGEHPAVRESGLCRQCLGSRKVANLKGFATGKATGGLLELPCPACQG